MGFGYGRRRQRTEQHEKSMGSYEVFAWRDAMAIASFLADEIPLARAKASFGRATLPDLTKFERENEALLREFIQKPESQRPAYFRRITKEVSEATKIDFLVLAILGAVRAMRIMELRDQFRMVLAPGRGNRVTTAALYAFSNEMLTVFDYDWPDEVFEAADLDADDDSDD